MKFLMMLTLMLTFSISYAEDSRTGEVQQSVKAEITGTSVCNAPACVANRAREATEKRESNAKAGAKGPAKAKAQ